MKIVYDISVLGAGFYKNHSQTGVFRVIEEIFLQLLNHKEIDLYLTASDNYRAHKDTINYLNKLNNHGKFHFLECFEETNKLRNKLVGKVKTLSQSYQHEKTLRLLCQREFIRSCYKIIPKYNEKFIPETIDSADIFHSPFLPIKEEILSLAQIKIFFTVYDLILIKFPEFFKGHKQEKLQNFFYKLNFDNYICCISEATKNDLLEINGNLDPKKVFVTHLAASDKFHVDEDPERFRKIRDKYKIPTEQFFLSLCTLEPRKNLPMIIRNFLDLVRSEKLNNVSLLLVGGKGWNYDDVFVEVAKAQELRNRIIFTGFVEDSELSSIYSNAIAFLYMSLYEGFGLPPLEAMQCGTPVITSNTSSLPEVVGDAGIMMDPSDDDGLKQAMLNLYEDKELRKKYSQKSLQQAQMFSWKKCADKTVNAYRLAMET